MTTTNSNEGLKRVIGVPGLTLSLISGIIGAGIFALPAIVSTALGTFAMFAYIVCGVLLASILFCYAEIGSRVTTSGGSYAYVEAAFGNFPGYIVNWLYFFGWGILGSAALMNIIADSLAVLFPILAQPAVRIVFFFLVTVFMIWINVLGAKQGIGIVKIVTIIKMLPLFAIIVFGFSYVKADNLRWEHLPSFKTFSDTTLVLFFAFAGFEVSLGASGEIKNPKRSVPISICIAGIVVLVVYLLLQIVAQGVLGSDMSLFKSAPLAAVADKIVGPVGGTILLLCAVLSSFGNVTLDILCTPRFLFAGANDGLFPKYLGKIHPKFNTPYLALITYGSLIFIFSTAGGFQQLAIMASAIILLVYLAVIMATIKLRKKKIEGDEKTFKAPGGLVTPLIGVVAIIWLLTNLGKWEILSTLIFIAAIIVIYFVTRRLRRKNALVEIVN
jgi:amino acid transporter